MPSISYLISYRNSSPERARSLDYILAALATLDELEIILVEQDSKPHFQPGTRADNIRYQFVFNPGLFNKSWGLNLAATLASSDQFIIGDADMLLSKESYQLICSALNQHVDAINPYDTLIDLNEAETQALHGGSQCINIQQQHDHYSRLHNSGQVAPFCGGVYAITRHLFQRCGGMDERFLGWGAEDNAMSLRINHFAKKTLTLEGQIAYHLWHPDGYSDPEQNQPYLRNLARLGAYYEFSDSFYQTMADHDIQTNASPDKYQPNPSHASAANHSPLISCLCVTRNRVDALKQAIVCFEQQSYPEKELLIVYEEDDFQTHTFTQTLKHGDIRCLSIPAQPKLALGTLRNRAIEAARGSYICQWDDDDWYHPRRLELQFKAALDQGKPGSILPRWLIYAKQTQQAYCSNIRFWEGSLLCKRSTLICSPGYPAIAKGEDTELIEYLYIQDQLAIEDRPDLYVYIHSGKNTWDDQHFNRILQASTALSAENTQQLRSLIGLEGTEQSVTV